jgi:hypothetical protein
VVRRAHLVVVPYAKGREPVQCIQVSAVQPDPLLLHSLIGTDRKQIAGVRLDRVLPALAGERAPRRRRRQGRTADRHANEVSGLSPPHGGQTPESPPQVVQDMPEVRQRLRFGGVRRQQKRSPPTGLRAVSVQ